MGVPLISESSAVRVLVFDLEATCWADEPRPFEQEIIEIGAAIFSLNSLESSPEFQAFVQPVRHPVLTPFCTELTTITQADVAAAEKFPVVSRRFLDWAKEYSPIATLAWGNYDRLQFQQDCDQHGLENPLRDLPHVNLKRRFAHDRGWRHSVGLGAAIKKLGLTFQGTPHRGLDDVRNICQILRHTRLTRAAILESPRVNHRPSA